MLHGDWCTVTHCPGLRRDATGPADADRGSRAAPAGWFSREGHGGRADHKPDLVPARVAILPLQAPGQHNPGPTDLPEPSTAYLPASRRRPDPPRPRAAGRARGGGEHQCGANRSAVDCDRPLPRQERWTADRVTGWLRHPGGRQQREGRCRARGRASVCSSLEVGDPCIELWLVRGGEDEFPAGTPAPSNDSGQEYVLLVDRSIHERTLWRDQDKALLARSCRRSSRTKRIRCALQPQRESASSVGLWLPDLFTRHFCEVNRLIN